jgi:RNA polymerase sigma factor (sigma-70 family)
VLNAKMQEPDDDALMTRVVARDGAAFRILIDAYQQRPYRIAWRMLNDREEAEDVAQEALLRLWSHAADWQAGGPGVAAWLARVATNLCLDRLRKLRFSSDEAVPERADTAPLADAIMGEEMMRMQTIAAIQALPERQRAAIILTYYEDQANAEAASTLDLNIKAFESLLLRARRALRESLVQRGLVSTGDLM